MAPQPRQCPSLRRHDQIAASASLVIDRVYTASDEVVGIGSAIVYTPPLSID
jgi:hypothetical protein